MLHILTWWFLIEILGLAALPLAYRLLKWLPGRGYALAKPLGLLLTSYVLWLGASLGPLQNTSGGILAALAITAGLSLWLYTRHSTDSDQSLLTFLRGHKRLVLTVEVLFAVAFCAWAALRAYAPDKIMSSGGEKFMEIAFLNAILKSRSFPPHDPWLSGFAISYYYFGYVMMALLTRLSGALPGIGFELYDALLFALTVTGAFGVVYNLVGGSKRPPASGRQPLRYGLLGSLFVAVMGNLEGFLEALYARGILPRSFWEWIDIPDLMSAARVTGSWYPGHGWWWWRASRVIRDRNLLGEPMPNNPIDEFPFFSFLLGDNHPHVLALPFVLVAIGLALNLLRRERTADRGEGVRAPWWKPAAYSLNGDWVLFLAYAVALGALAFLNTWDYPIYLGITVLAYGIGRRANAREETGELVRRTMVLGASLLVAGVLLYLPFYAGFQSQAGGVLPYLLPPTRLPQYLVMFGPFIFVITWSLVARVLQGTGLNERGEVKRRVLRALRSWGLAMLIPIGLMALVLSFGFLTEPGRQLAESVLGNPQVQQMVGQAGPNAVLKAVVLARLRDPWLFLALSFLIGLATVNILSVRNDEDEGSGPDSSHLFTSLLVFVGLVLTFSVEFIYLRDVFGVRMNTVFKFYYQGCVMLGCASAYGVWWVLSGRGQSRVARSLFLTGTAILVAAGMVYPLMASYSRVQGLQQEPHLNGTINVARNHPDDWGAIEWLRANADPTSTVLEAPGGSYEYEGRISAFTGLRAVLGWSLHESQWRGNYVEQGKREPDIATIYTTQDGQQALELLHRWKVDYVIVGAPERQYVEELCTASDRQCNPTAALSKFDQLLEPVFKQGKTAIYRVPQPEI